MYIMYTSPPKYAHESTDSLQHDIPGQLHKSQTKENLEVENEKYKEQQKCKKCEMEETSITPIQNKKCTSRQITLREKKKTPQHIPMFTTNTSHNTIHQINTLPTH